MTQIVLIDKPPSLAGKSTPAATSGSMTAHEDKDVASAANYNVRGSTTGGAEAVPDFAPLMLVQSDDFEYIMHLYMKLRRVKAFLDEIAEEFVDAQSVTLRHSNKESTQGRPGSGHDEFGESSTVYQIVVEYESH